MEKVVASRLHVHLAERDLIPVTKAGFRPGVRLHDQLIRVLTPIEVAHTHRHYAILVALDAQRAFDTVWIDALKYKLSLLLLPHEITRWISSFISNRTGQVRLGRSELSQPFRIEAGVPQGCVLSPILYNIFVSDIPPPIDNNVGLAQYADDVAFWATHPRLSSARAKINRSPAAIYHLDQHVANTNKHKQNTNMRAPSLPPLPHSKCKSHHNRYHPNPTPATTHLSRHPNKLQIILDHSCQ